VSFVQGSASQVIGLLRQVLEQLRSFPESYRFEFFESFGWRTPVARIGLQHLSEELVVWSEGSTILRQADLSVSQVDQDLPLPVLRQDTFDVGFVGGVFPERIHVEDPE
jgi:hypothetical protein